MLAFESCRIIPTYNISHTPSSRRFPHNFSPQTDNPTSKLFIGEGIYDGVHHGVHYRQYVDKHVVNCEKHGRILLLEVSEICFVGVNDCCDYTRRKPTHTESQIHDGHTFCCLEFFTKAPLVTLQSHNFLRNTTVAWFPCEKERELIILCHISP